MGGNGGADWVGLEEQVCAAAPFNTKSILPNHLTLVAFVAGLALAGFILLLDRGHDTLEGDRRRGHAIGALLLALSAVVGLVAAYMFSSITGDHCLNTALQFDFPSALLAIAALLMVSGISVAAASHSQLADTATALRWILVLAGALVCWRLFVDYERADAVSGRYATLIESVDRLSPASSGEGWPRAGSTSSLDQQLSVYAEHRWGDLPPAEWPGRLADDLFNGPSSASTGIALGTVALVGVAGAVALAVAMQSKRLVETPAGRRSPSGDVEEDLELVAERAWRRWVSRLTVTGTLIVLVMFTITAGSGDKLTHPPAAYWVVLFAVVVSLTAMIVQPPIIGEQRSLLKSVSTTLRRTRRAERSTSP